MESLKHLRQLFPTSVLFFLNLCKTRSYTQTARELSTSQSSISRAIIEMEQSLGFQLIERETRPIKITQMGVMLQDALLRSQTLVEHALVDIQSQNLVRIPFRMGIIESMADSLSSRLMKELSNDYSNALVLTGVSSRLLELLDSDRVDFIISSNPFSHRNDLKRHFLLQEPSVVVTPESLELSQPVTWNQLQFCGLPQISYDHANSGAGMERRLFNENGLSFVRRIEVDLNVLMMGMVVDGMGWALTRITSLVQFPKYAKRVNVYEMPDPLASREVFFIYKNEALSTLAEKAVRVINDIIKTSLIPDMVSWAPWIKPYLYVAGDQKPLDRVQAFPNEFPSRATTVL